MVERTITATIAAHPDCGVALWAPRRLRDMEGFQATMRKLDGHVEPVDKAAAVALDGLASRFAKEMAEERAKGIKTLILSEENFMGGMRNNFRLGAFYPDIGQRLASFDSLMPMSPAKIALGVRDYGAVWTSAYHYLPQAGQTPPPLKQVRDGLLDDPRGWPEVVHSVQDLWPDTSLVIWRQEDLARDIRKICASVSGLDEDLIVVPEGRINERKPDTPRPEVFSQEERKHLTHRYNRHIRRLRDTANIQWAEVA